MESTQPLAASNTQLVTRYANAHDQAAFAELVERFGPMVLGVSRRLLSFHEDADDATQLVFAELARRAGTIEDPEAVAGWLHTITVRVARRLRARRPDTKPLAVDPADPRLHIDEVSRRGELEILSEELDSLPASWREPLLLRYFAGLSNEDAATQLGTTVTALEGRLKRGKNSLRVRLLRRGIGVAGVLAIIQPASASSVAADHWHAVTDAASQLATDPAALTFLPPEPTTAATPILTFKTACAAGAAAIVLTMLGGDGDTQQEAQPLPRFSTTMLADEQAAEQAVEIKIPDSVAAESAIQQMNSADEEPAGDQNHNPEAHHEPANITQILRYDVDFQFVDTPLNEMLDFLSTSYDIPIDIDERSLKESDIDPERAFTFVAGDLKLDDALATILAEKIGGLDYVIRNNRLVITTTEAAAKELHTDIYDVPNVDIETLKSALVRHPLQSRRGPVGWLPGTDPENFTVPAALHDTGAISVVEFDDGRSRIPQLVVTQSQRGHEAVEKILDSVRQAASVVIESRQIKLNVEDVLLYKVLEQLSEMSRRDIRIADETLDQLGKPKDFTDFSTTVNGQFETVEEALAACLTETIFDLDYVRRGDSLVVVTQEQAAKETYSVIYDVDGHVASRTADLFDTLRLHGLPSTRGPIGWNQPPVQNLHTPESANTGTLSIVDSESDQQPMRLLVTQSDRGHEAFEKFLTLYQEAVTHDQLGDVPADQRTESPAGTNPPNAKNPHSSRIDIPGQRFLYWFTDGSAKSEAMRPAVETAAGLVDKNHIRIYDVRTPAGKAMVEAYGLAPEYPATMLMYAEAGIHATHRGAASATELIEMLIQAELPKRPTKEPVAAIDDARQKRMGTTKSESTDGGISISVGIRTDFNPLILTPQFRQRFEDRLNKRTDSHTGVAFEVSGDTERTKVVATANHIDQFGSILHSPGLFHYVDRVLIELRRDALNELRTEWTAENETVTGLLNIPVSSGSIHNSPVPDDLIQKIGENEDFDVERSVHIHHYDEENSHGENRFQGRTNNGVFAHASEKLRFALRISKWKTRNNWSGRLLCRFDDGDVIDASVSSERLVLTNLVDSRGMRHAIRIEITEPISNEDVSDPIHGGNTAQ